MGNKLFIALVALVFILSSVDGHSLRVASFNIRVFGGSKQRNTVAMGIITDIIKKYDVIQLQEVRENLDIAELLNQVGSEYAVCNDQLHKAKSGAAFKPTRSRHREMYLFLYRIETIKCIETIECEEIYPKCPAKSFRRPPTAALFEIVTGLHSGKQFFVIGIHTQPTRAVEEIRSLPDAYNAFFAAFLENKHIIFFGAVMGDFNYGGSYVHADLMDSLNIDDVLTRLLDKSVQTSVKSGHPYDRIYVTKRSPINFNGGVDRYMGGLTSYEQYYKIVSDHYPAYFEADLDVSDEISDPTAVDIDEDVLNQAINDECHNSLYEMAVILSSPQLSKEELYIEMDVIFAIECFECCLAHDVQVKVNDVNFDVCSYTNKIVKELCGEVYKGNVLDTFLKYWCSQYWSPDV